jgi:hypothetical protein
MFHISTGRRPSAPPEPGRTRIPPQAYCYRELALREPQLGKIQFIRPLP